jgi:hypothetical protein
MNPIPLLQRYLAQFLSLALSPEDVRLGAAGTLGPATLDAVEAFLDRAGLIAPPQLRPRSGEWVDWLIGELEAALGARRTISGRVVGLRGNGIAGLRVAALERDLPSIERRRPPSELGHDISGEGGRFDIRYAPTPEGEGDEAAAADVSLAIADAAGEPVAIIELRLDGKTLDDPHAILFNIPPRCEMQVTVNAETLRGLSEYERLLARIAPALRDLAPAELTAEDVAFLAAEVPLSEQDRQRVEWLRRAAALAERSGLPTEAFYGWGRLDLPDRFTSLAATPPDRLEEILARLAALDPDQRQKFLEDAVAKEIIPERIAGMRDVLERSLAQSRPMRRVGTARLVDREDGAPLPNLEVSFGPPGGQAHATIPSDPRGYVPILAPPDGDAAGTVLVLTVRGAEDAPRLEVQLTLPLAEEVIELRVPRPAPPDAPDIDALDATAKLALPAGLAAAHARQGVRSLAEITRRGGLSGLAGLPVADGHPSLKLLEAHADLLRASDDVPANTAVIEAGFDGIAAVAMAPRARFVAALGPKIGDLVAGQLHAAAGAQTALLNNATFALAAERANGQADPDAAEVVLGPERCECRDCETAVSPLAYLVDLIAFVERRVSANGNPATVSILESAFHQPIATLPAKCGEVDREVRQVRICIEVVRAALGPRPLANAADEAALAAAEAAYSLAAYEALLLRLGTSSAEIRLAATADGAARAALAERLQVPLANLNKLHIDFTKPRPKPEPGPEAEIEANFGIRDTTKAPLDSEVASNLLNWRRDALREAWRRQDQPDDRYAPRRVTAPLAALPPALVGPGALPKPLSFDEAAQLLICDGEMLRADLETMAGLAPSQDWQRALRTLYAAARCLPAIDPDLVGPDDLRTPRPGEAAFDLWTKRRDWVDARLAVLAAKTKVKDGTKLPDFEEMVAEMAKPLDYAGSKLEPWPGVIPDLTALGAALSGTDAELARFRLEQELNLSEPALGRLLALRGKLAARMADVRTEAPSAAEAIEVRSILVQSMKARFSEIWRAEEVAAGLRFGPAIFWPSLTTPVEGAWPPEPRPAPLLDPLRMEDTDLPDPVAGEAAAGLLAERRAQLAAVKAELRKAAEARDFDLLFRAALGDPKPGNNLQHDIDQLRADLGSSVQATADEAQRRVTEDLGLRIEDFRRLLAIRAAAAAKAIPPTAADWDEAVALLLPARIAKHERNVWREKEGEKPIGPLPYWAALKARLPPWRTSAEARAAWQTALRARSEAPVLDPDLIVPGDLRAPVKTDAAFKVLDAREKAVNAKRSELAKLAKSAIGFDARLTQVLGYGTAHLLGIAAARDAGRAVASRLAQLRIDFAGFGLLERVARLLKVGAGVTSAEWDAAHDVLLVAWKRLQSADWLEEERRAGVLLGPDIFLPPAADDTGWTANPWRAPASARQAFRDALQARFDADTSVAAAMAAVVDGAEEAVLPALRDALVAALPQPPGAPTDAVSRLEAGAKWVGANLLIDARTGACAKTTRIAQAIETLQSLVLMLRAGQAGPALAGWALDIAEHDREWPWMGSYAAWRSAAFVQLYPENLLHPVLRRDKSPALADLLKATSGAIGRKDACAAARDYATYLRDVARMSVEVTCTARTVVSEGGDCNPPQRDERCFFYMFGLGDASGRPYVARYDVQGGGQSWWTPIDKVPGFDNLTALIGAVPYRTSAGRRFIFLIGHREAANESGLVCAKYDLDGGEPLSNWGTTMPDLKMPAFDNRRFNAVVKQTDDEDEPPHVVVHNPNGAGTTYMECHMNAAGTAWDGEFRPLQLFGNDYRPPVGMIRFRENDFVLIVQGGWLGSYWCYRSTDSLSPQRYRINPNAHYSFGGRYVGAFAWKGIDGVFLLTNDTPPKQKFGSNVAVDDPNFNLAVGPDSFRLLEPDESLGSHPHQLTATLFLSSPFPLAGMSQQQDGAFGTGKRFRQVLPSWGATDDTVGKSARFVYRSLPRTEHHRPMLIRQVGAPRPSHFMRDLAPQPVLPDANGPLDLPISLTREQREVRRTQQQSAAASIEAYPAWLRAYFDEAWYSARVALGLALHRSREYEAALDCLRTVFDDTAALGSRKIHPGLVAEEKLPVTFKRALDWLLDPLDPHAIAATRQNTHTRFVRIAILRCQLDWADEEFTRDTPESRPIARRLYQDVLDGLASPELSQGISPSCEAVIGTLDDRVDPRWVRALEPMKVALRSIGQHTSLIKVVGEVKAALDGAKSSLEAFAAARQIVDALPMAPQINLSEVIRLDVARRSAAQRALSASEPVATAVAGIRDSVASEFRRAASIVAGLPQPKLLRSPASLGFLREVAVATAKPRPASLAVLRGMADGSIEDVLAPTRLSAFTTVFEQAPQTAMGILTAFPSAIGPSGSLAFCIPPNPVLAALRARAEVNLRKLRTCRSISGLRRAVDPYGAPTDAVSGMPILGAGGVLVLPGLRTLPPTLYRYLALVERAKQMAQMASQMEGAMLAALERRDAAALAVLKARQDLELAGAGVRLQDFRVNAAQGRVSLAKLGEKRARVQKDHFANMIAKGESEAERMAIALLEDAVEFLDTADDLQVAAAVIYMAQVAASAFAGAITGNLPVPGGGTPIGAGVGALVGALQNLSAVATGINSYASALTTRAQIRSTRSSIWSMRATFERRAQEWQFQSDLADVDIELAHQQTQNSEGDVSISKQEREIAAIQQRHARDTLEFLTTKQFGSAELYEWMGGVLQDVYRYFLQQATATARLAEAQLAFERQEPPPAILLSDYWRADGAASAGNDAQPDRRGVTGSARLLRDITRLDQHAFETRKRKLQLTKTFSLSRLAPVEFQRFRETGVITFATPMEMFDRDFPGHYLRLVSRVALSVVALIPPLHGVRATLSSSGLSRVVIGPDVFQTVPIRREPEQIALSAAANATGLLDLEPQPDMLRPFEGCGVEGVWELRMPRASNPFDYRTIADVLLTIDYTALDSPDYRQQVLRALPSTNRVDAAFSFRNQLPDQWFDLNNPTQTASPMRVSFRLLADDFPPNLEEPRIEHIALYASRRSMAELPISRLVLRQVGAPGAIGGAARTVDGLASTRTGSGAAWAGMIGRSPVGEWELELPNTDDIRQRFTNGDLRDLFLVVSVVGRIPNWPD